MLSGGDPAEYFANGSVKVTSIEPRRTAVVEAAPGDAPTVGACRGDTSTARITDHSANSVTIAVDSECAGLLVLTDTQYPGWEATVDGRDDLGALLRSDLHDRLGESRQHRRVTAQDADITVDRSGDDHGGPAAPDHAVCSDELHLKCVRHQRLFWISAHFASTSSRPPHMKNACSATWSYSPSAILLNASMVSLTGTVEPSMPVNCLAT